MSTTFVPHNYQIPEIENMTKKSIYGLGMYPGLGKTPSSLLAVMAKREVDPKFKERGTVLVIAPLSIATTTWMHEHLKWDQTKDLKVRLIDGTPKRRQEIMNQKADVFVINPEKTQWLVNELKNRHDREKARMRHKKNMTGQRVAMRNDVWFPFDILIIDESITFKNHKSERFKALKKILKWFKSRHILTGNPVPKSLMDLWSQVYILDLGKRLGGSFYEFQRRYFYTVDHEGWTWLPFTGSEQKILHKISDIFGVVTIDDAGLELPERVIVDHPIKLSKENRVAYDSMAKNLYFELSSGDSENLIADSRNIALMKCAQMTSGFVYETNEETGERITHRVGDEKMSHLKSLVQELNGNPCIILYNFIAEAEALQKEFPTARTANAKMTPAELRQLESDWNSDKVDIVISHMRKLSHGLNLQYTSKPVTVIFFGLTYNYDTFDQICFRFQRQGSTNRNVMVHRLVVEKSVDEAMVKAINERGSMKEFVFNFLSQIREVEDLEEESEVA